MHELPIPSIISSISSMQRSQAQVHAGWAIATAGLMEFTANLQMNLATRDS